MQKRWSVNSMMLAFAAFAVVLIVWVLYGLRHGLRQPVARLSTAADDSTSFFGNFIGQPGAVLDHAAEQGQATIPLVGGPPWHFPQSTLVYFQFVFAAITPILMLGSVLGRINFKAWLRLRPALDHLRLRRQRVPDLGRRLLRPARARSTSRAATSSTSTAGVAGFVAAAVIGPRLARDREIDAPNNLLMVATGAGLLWLGWNGFNGGDPYYAGADAAAAVLNTNLAHRGRVPRLGRLGLHDRAASRR